MNTSQGLHETAVSDLFDYIKDGVDTVMAASRTSVAKTSSIKRATEGLTLTFPVICSSSASLEDAVMNSKMIERQNVSLLQMAFSAYEITNAKDAISHLSKFHTNLDYDKLTVDKFIDVMDALGESVTVFIETKDIQAVYEDCRRNTNFVFEEDINLESVSQFKFVNRFGKEVVVKEAKDDPYLSFDNMFSGHTARSQKTWERYWDRYKDFDKAKKDKVDQDWKTYEDLAQKYSSGAIDKEPVPPSGANVFDADGLSWEQRKDILASQRQKMMDKETISNNANRNKIEVDKNKLTKDKNDFEKEKWRIDSDTRFLSNQLVSGDVRKANEAQPSLMIVRFFVNDADNDLNVVQQCVCGVKAKLYPVDSGEIINNIARRNSDANTLLKLIKVSTREISFVKDFLLGIDDAKLDALTRSKKGSSTSLFKALEKRYIKGKIRRGLRLENSAKAISSLIITQEDADVLSKYHNVDVYNEKIMIPIMERLNLLNFIIIDSTSEAIHLLADGDSRYEVLPFTALEREAGDGAYKKVVNLLTKMR